MLLVKSDTGVEVEVNTVRQLLSMIPENALDSLKVQINNESAFGGCLGQFIAQKRRGRAR